MPTLTFPGQRGFIGLASEAVKGTPVAATSWIQLLSEGLAPEPGLMLPKLIRGSRQTAFVPVLGEQSVMGKIETPLYVDQGMALLAALIGTDTWQTSSAGGTAITLGASAVAPAGAAVVTITNQTGTPIAASDFIELHQGAVGVTVAAANLSEIHKVASVSGAGPYVLTLTAGETLVNAYTTTGSIARIPAATAVFTHTLLPDIPNAGTYKTLTVEKNRAGLDSRQYAGTLVNKGSFSFDSKNVARASYDLMSLTDVNVGASTPVYGSSAPLALANFALSLFGSSDTSVVQASFDIDNGGKGFWTFSGSNMPTVIPPLERKITGKWKNIVQTAAYSTNAMAGTTGAQVLTLILGTSSIVLTLPEFEITKIGQPLVIGDLFQYDVDWQASYDEATSTDIKCVVINSAWLPFV